MRVNAVFNADVAKRAVVVHHEKSDIRSIQMAISFTLDEDETTKRFGKKLAGILFAAYDEDPQGNLFGGKCANNKDGAPAYDPLWRFSAMTPRFAFKPHELTLGGIGPFVLQPTFMPALPVKREAKVTFQLGIEILVDDEEDLGALASLTGEQVKVELKTEISEEAAAKPKVIKTDGPFGNQEATLQ